MEYGPSGQGKGSRGGLAAVAGIGALTLAAPVVALALPFLVMAAATRLIARAIGTVKLTPWARIISYDPEIGWRPSPGVTAWRGDMAGDPFPVRTDEEGWVDPDVTVDDADVLVLGDGFAFATAVEDGSLFTDHAGNVTVKAIGAPGYNMVQELLLMKQLESRLGGKLVVWLIYLGNDLDDNLRPHIQGYRAPFVRRTTIGDWEIERGHLRPEPWPYPARVSNQDAFVRICSGEPLAGRAFSACEFLIASARSLCEGAGAELAVVTIPELSDLAWRQVERARRLVDPEGPFDPGRPDREIAAICHRMGVRFFALRDRLDARDYRRSCHHWSARGQRRVGAVIGELYTARNASQAEAERPPNQEPSASNLRGDACPSA
jgi:hypothetical protein